MNNRSVALLVMGLWLSLVGIAGDPAYAAQDNIRSQRSLSLQLYNLTGSGQERSILDQRIRANKIKADFWTHGKVLYWLGYSEAHIEIINEIYSNAFKPQAYYGQILKRISKNYNRRHVLNSINFFKSAIGRKSVSLQIKAMKATSKAYQNFLSKLIEKVEKKERLELWDRLARATGEADIIIEQVASLLRLTIPVAREFHAPDAEVLINRLRADLGEQIRSTVILNLMFKYKSFSDRELTKMVQYYESPAGEWFKKAMYEGNLSGYATVNHNALRSMEKIMKLIESGHQSLETTRAVFAPGLRYLFSDKRDPFAPLVGLEKEEPPPPPVKVDQGAVAQQNSLEILGQEIEAIPGIPYEIYQRVKEADPRLYADLEYYGSLFKNRNTLAKMKPEDLKEEIEQYTSLIRRANEEVGQLVVTPLQASLNELKLAGIIWDEKETIGLIETPDSKGHAVRVGSFLGPNYGLIESINEERVVILEKFRNYDGKVISVTQYIEFPKPESEE